MKREIIIYSDSNREREEKKKRRSRNCWLINVINLVRIGSDEWCDYETTQVWSGRI